jgi:glycine cleavage system H lipoate-binding protein
MMEQPWRAHRGCAILGDLACDLERNMWVRFEADGSATMGLTDPAQTRASG